MTTRPEDIADLLTEDIDCVITEKENFNYDDISEALYTLSEGYSSEYRMSPKHAVKIYRLVKYIQRVDKLDDKFKLQRRSMNYTEEAEHKASELLYKIENALIVKEDFDYNAISKLLYVLSEGFSGVYDIDVEDAIEIYRLVKYTQHIKALESRTEFVL